MKKDYRQQLEVKEWMVTALLQLMEKIPYDEITVTQIARTAGVNRMTYYRNYATKDDILIQYSKDLSQEMGRLLREQKNTDLRSFLSVQFDFVYQHDRYIRTLLKNRKEYIILDIINENVRKITSGDPTVMRYYAGGLYNVLMNWVKSDYQEPSEDIIDQLLTVSDSAFYQAAMREYAQTFDKLS